MEKSKIIEKLFSYIVTYSYLLIPLGLLTLRVKKKEKFPVVLGIYAIVCFILLLVFESIPLNDKKYYFATYTTLEYLSFSFLIGINISSKKYRKFIIVTSLCFILFEVLYLFLANPQSLDSVPIGIETIIIFLFIFLFFYDFSKKPSLIYIYNHHCFWLSVGILIYLGGSFFFYILINHLTKEERIVFGNLTYLAELIKNLLFVVVIYFYQKNPQISENKKSSSIPYLDMI